MGAPPALTVVLRSQNELVQDLREQAEQDLAAARETSDRLDELEAELFGTTPRTIDQPSSPRSFSPRSAPPTRPLSELRQQAEAHLDALGIDPTTANLDSLLDESEIRRIENRFDPNFSLHARLDTFDIIAVTAAGLVAALLDFFVVGIPKNTKWWGGAGPVKASPLTERLRSLAVESDNPLSKWAKVSYDRVSNLEKPIDGFSGRTHRIQTFGHDPLLGLLYGTRDIIRGTMTAIPRGGGIVTQQITDGVTNPFLAFIKQLAHLLSDVATKDGLPIPGWTALVSLDGPRFGPMVSGGPIGSPSRQENIGEIARRMYLNGFDSWHFLTMHTSALAVDLVLRGYWCLRSYVDEEWKELIDAEADRNRSSGVSDHPRFASMSLGAHGVATAGNLVKFGVSGGNPLTINVVQSAAFLRAFFRWTNQRAGSMADRIDRTMRANARAAEAGWSRFDFTDPEFETMATLLQ